MNGWWVRFQENNREEGEVWTIFVPLTGNEITLRFLHHWIRAEGLDRRFAVDFEPLSDEDVTVFCRRAAQGYLPSHSSADGRLDLTRIPGFQESDLGGLIPGGVFSWPEIPSATLASKIGKGAIRDLFVSG